MSFISNPQKITLTPIQVSIVRFLSVVSSLRYSKKCRNECTFGRSDSFATCAALRGWTRNEFKKTSTDAFIHWVSVPTHLSVSTRSWRAGKDAYIGPKMFKTQLESKSVTAWSPLSRLHGLSLSIVLVGRKLLSVNNAKPRLKLFPQSFSRLRRGCMVYWRLGRQAATNLSEMNARRDGD